MILFSNTITPRLSYIADFIGRQLNGESLRVTQSQEEFGACRGPAINYSNTRITENEIWVKPHSLLFETGVTEQDTACFDNKGIKIFFRNESDLSFDVFAASFYLLSRYEEWLPHTKDSYGRYSHENSIAWQNDFLSKPLVNIWIRELKKLLLTRWPTFQLRSPSFSFLPTYDIDEAYSYRYKSLWRTAGAMGKALLKGNWSRLKERRLVLGGKLEDPYDSFEYMDLLHHEYDLKPRYFFLVAAKTGKYDRNILPSEKAMEELIRKHAEKYTVGIHPSWQTGDDPGLLSDEIKTIEKITGKKINSSRQHFIRFSVPQTFRLLIESGIREDFSMGYGSINGFRASVSSPFHWYDLEKESTTPLVLYPFCFMEANSFFEQKQTPAESLEELRYYYQQVKVVDGMLVTLWHNTFLGKDVLFKGWRETYEEFLKEATSCSK